MSKIFLLKMQRNNRAGENKAKKNTISGIIQSVIVRKVSLKNSNLMYDKGKQPLEFHDLNATVNGIEIGQKEF